MIIFGTASRVKRTAQHGQFYCPTCDLSTTYTPVQLQTYHHLFGIPFGIISEANKIECSSCQTLFDEGVLSERPKQSLKTWICPSCGRDWPETNIACAMCRVRPDGSAI